MINVQTMNTMINAQLGGGGSEIGKFMKQKKEVKS